MMSCAKQTEKGTKPRMAVINSALLCGTSSDTTRRVSAKPNTTSQNASGREISPARQRKYFSGSRPRRCSAGFPIFFISSLLSFHFAHKREQIVFAVAEERHPQIMVRHFGDHMRLVFELHAFLFHPGERRLNIGHGEVKNRAGVVKPWLRRPLEHQPHSIAVEKCQPRRRFKEQPQSENILIEIRRALHIMRAHLNLPDAGDSDSLTCTHHKIPLVLKKTHCTTSFVNGAT